MVEDLEMECPTKLLNPLKRKEEFRFLGWPKRKLQGRELIWVVSIMPFMEYNISIYPIYHRWVYGPKPNLIKIYKSNKFVPNKKSNLERHFE